MKRKGFFLFLLMVISHYGGFSQEVEHPFADDIRKFKTIDSISPPAENPILFIGSSSFTMWKDVQLYFPGYSIINRGFGGSTFIDVIYYINDVVFPYKPKQVVIYCGENDFAASDSVTSGMVNSRFVKLFELIRNKMPDVKITYVSMKPCPSRWHLKTKFILSNDYIRKFLKRQPNTSFVDVWHKMLDKKGQPNENIYLEDQLHMNPEGYKIWKKAISPHLIK